jgi:hypothetical protein
MSLSETFAKAEEMKKNLIAIEADQEVGNRRFYAMLHESNYGVIDST